MKNVLLTGPKGIGKTTIVKKAVRRLADRAGGFFCEEERGDGSLRGIWVKTISGRTALLAAPALSGDCPEEGARAGDLGVDLAVIGGMVIPAIQEAVASKKVVVIDGLDPVLAVSPAFIEAAEQALAAENPVIGVIAETGGTALEALKSRDDTLVLTVTKTNREDLLDRIFLGLNLPTESFAETERNISKKREKAERYATENRLTVTALSAKFKSDHHEYEVTYTDGQWHCNCSFFLKYGTCSHSMASAIILEERLHDRR